MSYSGTFDPPCCGQCYLTASSVNLYYWPDEATALPGSVSAPFDSPSTLVNEEGFTFVSPSIYLAITSLFPHDGCRTRSDEIILSTTLGFDLSELSTLAGYEEYFPSLAAASYVFCSTLTEYWGTLTDLRPDDFSGTLVRTAATRALTISDVAQNCSTLPGYYYNSLVPSFAPDQGGMYTDALI